MSGEFSVDDYLNNPGKWWDDNPYALLMLWKLRKSLTTPVISFKETLALVTGGSMTDMDEIEKPTKVFMKQFGGFSVFLQNPPWLLSRYAMTTVAMVYIQKLYPIDHRGIYNDDNYDMVASLYHHFHNDFNSEKVDILSMLLSSDKCKFAYLFLYETDFYLGSYCDKIDNSIHQCFIKMLSFLHDNQEASLGTILFKIHKTVMSSATIDLPPLPTGNVIDENYPRLALEELFCLPELPMTPYRLLFTPCSERVKCFLKMLKAYHNPIPNNANVIGNQIEELREDMANAAFPTKQL